MVVPELRWPITPCTLASTSFWAAAVRIASPLIFATMGELICERAGVLNLGIEGIMVIGAFTTSQPAA